MAETDLSINLHKTYISMVDRSLQCERRVRLNRFLMSCFVTALSEHDYKRTLYSASWESACSQSIFAFVSFCLLAWEQTTNG